jgi:hypothetical protein
VHCYSHYSFCTTTTTDRIRTRNHSRPTWEDPDPAQNRPEPPTTGLHSLLGICIRGERLDSEVLAHLCECCWSKQIYSFIISGVSVESLFATFYWLLSLSCIITQLAVLSVQCTVLPVLLYTIITQPKCCGSWSSSSWLDPDPHNAGSWIRVWWKRKGNVFAWIIPTDVRRNHVRTIMQMHWYQSRQI